jgi:hypothetical protein
VYDRVEIKQPIASIWGSFGFVAVFIQNQAPHVMRASCGVPPTGGRRCVSVAQGFILFGIRLKARLPVQTRLLKLTLDQSRSRVCPGESLHRDGTDKFCTAHASESQQAPQVLRRASSTLLAVRERVNTLPPLSGRV